MKSCETKERQEDAVLLVYTMKHSRQDKVLNKKIYDNIILLLFFHKTFY